MPTTRTVARTMRIAVLAAVVAVGSLDAQTERSALPGDSVPASILDAEEQGRRFVTLVARPVLPRAFNDPTVEGSSRRRCLRADEQPILRAGDFLIGPFNQQRHRWSYKKLWWVPASEAGELRVVAVHLERAAPPRIIHQPDVAYPSGGDPTDTFHPSMIGLSARGPWMLVATSGSSWGCVLVDVP